MKSPTHSPNLKAMRLWWVLAHVIAWSASHRLLMGQGIRSTRDAIPMTIVVLLDGLLIGAILGFGGWFALRQITSQADGWFHATVWPQAVAVAAGWFLNLAVANIGGARMGLPILVEGGGTSVSPSPGSVLAMVGATVGISQWFVLRRFVPRRPRHMLLWVFGSIAGLVAGWWVGAYVSILAVFGFPGTIPLTEINLYFDISNILSGAVMGLISGGTTGSILLILLAQRPEGAESNRVAAV